MNCSEFVNMPANCGVIGCANMKNKFTKKSFYRLPAVDKRYGGVKEKITRERRGKWLANLARADLSALGKSQLRVCSDHFVSGKYSLVSYLKHNIGIKAIIYQRKSRVTRYSNPAGPPPPPP